MKKSTVWCSDLRVLGTRHDGGDEGSNHSKKGSVQEGYEL
jgi:hypothetical protein